jgi:hypothetical protein
MIYVTNQEKKKGRSEERPRPQKTYVETSDLPDWFRQTAKGTATGIDSAEDGENG